MIMQKKKKSNVTLPNDFLRDRSLVDKAHIQLIKFNSSSLQESKKHIFGGSFLTFPPPGGPMIRHVNLSADWEASRRLARNMFVVLHYEEEEKKRVN